MPVYCCHTSSTTRDKAYSPSQGFTSQPDAESQSGGHGITEPQNTETHRGPSKTAFNSSNSDFASVSPSAQSTKTTQVETSSSSSEKLITQVENPEVSSL